MSIRTLDIDELNDRLDELETLEAAIMDEKENLALCNGWRQQEAHDKKRASIEAKANEIAGHYWLRAKAGGDPRGFCLHLFSTNKKRPLGGNTWGGDEAGWGI